jgi:hypothetical protein
MTTMKAATLALPMIVVALATAPRALGAQVPSAETEFAFEARVSVQTPLVVGKSSHGLRRIVPITGGTFEGPNIRGRVVPGGADWQFCAPMVCSSSTRATRSRPRTAC